MPVSPPDKRGKHYDLSHVMTVHTQLSITKALMLKIDAEADEKKVSRAHIIHKILEDHYDLPGVGLTPEVENPGE